MAEKKFPPRSALRSRVGATNGVAGQAVRWRLHPLNALLLVVLLLALLFVGGVRQYLQAGTPNEVDLVTQSQSSAPKGHGLEEIGGGEQSADNIVVYVTGEVADPKLVQVPAGARVGDAIEAAGGMLSSADMSSQNLAREAGDGEHIHVAKPGESGPSKDRGSAATGPSEESTQCVDLNAADEQALQVLDGIGPKLAERIVTHRESVGGFNDVEQLLAVPGIGPVLFERISAGVC